MLLDVELGLCGDGVVHAWPSDFASVCALHQVWLSGLPVGYTLWYDTFDHFDHATFFSSLLSSGLVF